MASISIIPESLKIIKLTDEEYFRDYPEYVSNSKLSLINPQEGGSIEKYKEGFTGSYSDSFELGSAVHGMLLQPDLYTISNIRKPSGKLGVFADIVYKNLSLGKPLTDELINECCIQADYYAGKLTDKRKASALEICEPYWESRRLEVLPEDEKAVLYLSEALFQKFSCCIENLDEKSEVIQNLNPSGMFITPETFNEYAIFADLKVELDGGDVKIIKFKAKLDNFIIDRESQELVLNDLKTTGKPISFFMGNQYTDGDFTTWYDGSFQKFHYARQMGAYLWLLNAAVMQLYNLQYKLRANMLVVETTPEFKNKVFKVTKGQIFDGLAEFKKLVILVAENVG